MELCTILSTYSSTPMLHVTIFTEEVTAIIRYVAGIGYTLASERGVIEADSWNQLIHLFKMQYCPQDILEPLINYTVK